MSVEKRSGVLKQLLAGALLCSTTSLVGCHSSKRYEASVEVERITSVRKNEKGDALTTDLEVSYVDCPGTQVEVIRGGEAFSSCVAKLKVGDRAKVKLEHRWDPEGFYDYVVYEVEGCARPPDVNDQASYKVVRECSDWNVNGVQVGFQCDYADKKDLVKDCPWFRRR